MLMKILIRRNLHICSTLKPVLVERQARHSHLRETKTFSEKSYSGSDDKNSDSKVSGL